jgi:hypothetical protein
LKGDYVNEFIISFYSETYQPRIIVFPLLFSVPLFAAQYTEEISTQEYLFAKGLLRDVSPANLTITIQQKNGPRISKTLRPNLFSEHARTILVALSVFLIY